MSGEALPRHFLLTEKAMRFADNEKTTLRINEHVSLSGIPAEAAHRLCRQWQDTAGVVH